jgi:pimeloyl-ACP methyl ester carboxylesterase
LGHTFAAPRLPVTPISTTASFSRSPSEATALYGWRPYMHDPALAHWLHRITCPTLVLWGVEDGIVPPSYGAQLADALPDALFVTVSAAAHYPQIEEPEQVAALIERFAFGEHRP